MVVSNIQDNTMNTSDISINQSSVNSSFHTLKNKWNLWAHLPHDTDWTINSYKHIYKFTTAEETIAINEFLPECLVKNCMLFVMKEGIMPMWEDAKNRNGGSFSYKVLNKSVQEVWKQLNYLLVGESLSANSSFVNNITGITISPKKNFCIVKIWLTNCNFQNPEVVTSAIKGISSQGCLFKKHSPEY